MIKVARQQGEGRPEGRRQGVGSPLPYKREKFEPCMNQHWKHKRLLILLILSTLASCSIKEERGECPCWLDIVVSGCRERARNVTVSTWNPEMLFSEGIDVEDYPDYYERTVPKGFVNVSVYAGQKNQTLSGENLVIPDGKECDSLWVHRSLVDCSGEFASDTATLHKQFATIFLKIDNLAPGEEYPYELVIRSGFDGLRLTDCTPHAGVWALPLRRLPDGTYSFRVPRQGDGTLSLDLLLDGEKIDEYPIGEHILRAGYSWFSEDLEDIRIGMDYGRSEIHISVESWEEGASYDAVI